MTPHEQACAREVDAACNRHDIVKAALDEAKKENERLRRIEAAARSHRAAYRNGLQCDLAATGAELDKELGR